MTTMTKNERLNHLALSYNNGNEFALIELAEELGGFIRTQARNAARKAEEKSIFIPAADFESVYTQALWEATKDYDGSSEFIQRFRTRMKPREADVYRTYRTSKDGEPTYLKGKNDYLDKPVGGVGEDDRTLGDVVLIKMATPSAEDYFVSENALIDTIEEFRNHNERFYTLVKALANHATNEELAQAIGEVEYNGKVRAVVFRARESFKKFLTEKEFDI